QARAMGNALEGAHIRMYGGSNDGTMDTIRGLFNSGFGLGEAMDGLAHSMPEGLRDRFNANGLRGLFGRPADSGLLLQTHSQLKVLVDKEFGSKKAQEAPLSEAIKKLDQAAGNDPARQRAVGVLKELVARGGFEDVPFATIWSLLSALTEKSD
ncbi:MAG: hypothetical protein OXC54_02545, partial [Rhodospirillaceae bacterium]|nr:hypothetical protein [Rhodospirillaceae bacterium]